MTRSARRGLLAWMTGLVVVGGLGAAPAAGARLGTGPGGYPSPTVATEEPDPGSVHPVRPGRALPVRPPRAAAQRPGAHGAGTRAATRRLSATVVTGSLAPLEDSCPVGLRRSQTLYADSFEKSDLPEPTLTRGFIVSSEGAAQGTRFAHSTLNTSTVPAPDTPYHVLFLPLLTTSPTARTIVSFQVKGNYGADTAYVAVNDSSGWIEPSPQWRTVTVDVTASVSSPTPNRAPGEMDIRFLNYPQRITGTTTVGIDNVQVYQCTTPPATGVRGDFDGDQVSDLVAIDTGGALWALPGRRDGTLGAPLRIGRGWQQFTWIGSPGDVTGDRRPDIIARRADGRLFLYAGRGMGAFARGVQIGVGWNSLNAILTPGDTNGDNAAELMGRDHAGRLFRWTFTPGARALVAKTQIGFGFGIFSRLLSPGDLNLDRRGDLVGIRRDGLMVAYYPNATGQLSRGVSLSRGWSAFTAVSGPGDLTGDGRGDIVTRRSDGTLWTFAALTRPAGVLGASQANQYRLFAS